ncbi:HAD-IA family hydrolase, partial [bacterium]|nr:HAD-IA family hydrolase [bacterium]
ILLLKPLFGIFANNYLQSKKAPIKHVIFDLGDVLIASNKAKAFMHIGPLSILKYLLTLHNPAKIMDKAFEVIHQIKPLDKDKRAATTSYGNGIFPQLCTDWLAGTITCQDTLTTIHTFIDNNPNLFNNSAERMLVKKTVTFMFTPEMLAKTQHPVKAGIEFVKECKKRGLNVFILSNFDTESFEIIKKQNPLLFGLFKEENIFVSGYFGTVKPRNDFYEIFLQESGISAENCVFFDDQQANIDTAQKLGIHAVLCPVKSSLKSKPNIDHLKKQLDTLIAQHNTSAIIQDTQKA